jgi:hypothetical protein
MRLTAILAELDAEIATLEQARALLTTETERGRGRPKSVATMEKPAKKKRNLGPEGRKRIAEAVKKRWALQKKAAGK